MTGNYLSNIVSQVAKMDTSRYELKLTFYYFTYDGVEYCCTQNEWYANEIMRIVKPSEGEFEISDLRKFKGKDLKRLLSFRDFILNSRGSRSLVVSLYQCIVIPH